MKPLAHFAISVLLLSAAASSLAAAEPRQFRTQASLGGDIIDDTPAAVTLTANIINRTHNNFADLRIFDDANHEVPYVIYGKTLPGENRQSAKLEAIKYEALPNNNERITYKRPDTLTAIDGMQAIINGSDFEKNIQIETSDDNRNWKSLATCTIFDYSSRINLRNTKLDTPPTTARYLRLTISGDKNTNTPNNNPNNENIVIKYKDLEFRGNTQTNTPNNTQQHLVTDIEAWHGKTVNERQITDNTPLTISDTNTDPNGNTILNLSQTNLPLTQITLDIATKYFMREIRLEAPTGNNDHPWRQIAAGSIYRLPAANHEAKLNTSLQLDGQQYPNLRLTIINRDSTPLTVNTVTGEYPQRTLYLMPEKNRHYTLYCDAISVNTPRYDLPSVLPENSPELAKATIWNLSTPQNNPDFDAKHEKQINTDPNSITPTQLWLFRGLILLLASGLAFWAWSTLRKLK